MDSVLHSIADGFLNPFFTYGLNGVGSQSQFADAFASAGKRAILHLFSSGYFKEWAFIGY